MNINWGYRVALLYIGFVGLIVYLITRSVNEQIDLVTPDYYAQELKYQEKIESIERNNNLKQPVSIELTGTGISVGLPSGDEGKSITGSILLFRPSDKSKDRTYEITAKPGHSQLIPIADLEHGLYRVKVNYTIEGDNHYTEKQVVVNKDQTRCTNSF
jgi:hypothetical protein